MIKSAYFPTCHRDKVAKLYSVFNFILDGILDFEQPTYLKHLSSTHYEHIVYKIFLYA